VIGSTGDALAGVSACLAAAFLWAVAVTLFRRPVERYGARTVNLAKCLLATLLQGLTVWAAGQGSALLTASAGSLALVAASGVVGLTLGDTALFAAVRRIGVHRTLLLQTLSPVFAALIAFLWRGERITAGQAGGALLILAGVALVVAPRRPLGTPGTATLGEGARAAATAAVPGLAFALLAALGQGGGVVLAKSGMEEIGFLPASFLRLAAAALGLLLIGIFSEDLKRLGPFLRDRDMLARALPATLLGTYLALFLMMAGVALAPASVAAVLLATSPVFSLFLEAALERRAPDLRGLAGTLLAVAGVAVLSSG
jgi:drug/metabolite transporter (DMT)-like permease